jgi:methionine synthase II (cobalamin-independent)
MFATLAGGYPAADPADPAARAPSSSVADTLVREILAEQAAAGLGLLTDGGLRWPDPVGAIGAALLGDRSRASGPRWSGPITVDAWTFAATAADDLPVKQCLPGPYSLGRRYAPDEAARPALTLAFAAALAPEIAALAAAGCPFVQVDEDEAVRIGPDEGERALFREAHARLLAGLPLERPHLSLAISGGNADTAGPETFFSAAYDSHFFDLLEGPDNWRLVTRAPRERGIVLGVVDAHKPERDLVELVVWAIAYAASTGGRGEARIGIAPSGSLAGLPRAAARAKLELLGEVVRLIERRNEEPIAAALDPRAVDPRSGALGRWTPARDRRGS